MSMSSISCRATPSSISSSSAIAISSPARCNSAPFCSRITLTGIPCWNLPPCSREPFRRVCPNQRSPGRSFTPPWRPIRSGARAMTSRGQLRFWLIGLAVFLIVAYLLRGILLPFVAGMAVAYVLDPICDWLERHGCSRNWATIIVSIGFGIVVLIALLLLVPVLEGQIIDFAGRLPAYVDGVLNRVLPQLQTAAQRLGFGDLSDLRSSAAAQVGSIVGWIGGALARVL